jgi:hypothetical protein
MLDLLGIPQTSERAFEPELVRTVLHKRMRELL